MEAEEKYARSLASYCVSKGITEIQLNYDVMKQANKNTYIRVYVVNGNGIRYSVTEDVANIIGCKMSRSKKLTSGCLIAKGGWYYFDTCRDISKKVSDVLYKYGFGKLITTTVGICQTYEDME